jgi:hypothetical protein
VRGALRVASPRSRIQPRNPLAFSPTDAFLRDSHVRGRKAPEPLFASTRHTCPLLPYERIILPPQRTWCSVLSTWKLPGSVTTIDWISCKNELLGSVDRHASERSDLELNLGTFSHVPQPSRILTSLILYCLLPENCLQRDLFDVKAVRICP